MCDSSELASLEPGTHGLMDDRPNAPPAVRILIDDDFREWRVREIATPAYDRRSGTVLIFDSVGIARRVRDFPSDWMKLSDAALLALGNSVVATPATSAPAVDKPADTSLPDSGCG